MKKSLIVLIVLIIKTNLSFSQDVKFTWKFYTSFDYTYEVIVDNFFSRCFLTITGDNESREKEIIKKEIQIKNVDSLFTFLENYDFPIRTRGLADTLRTYYKTKILPKKNLVYANGLIFDIKLFPFEKDGKFYGYDKKLKKCYVEEIVMTAFLDGNSYHGEFTKRNSNRTYSIISSRLSTNDVRLNLMVLDLIERNDATHHFFRLREFIESDKPLNGEDRNQKRFLKSDKQTTEN